MFLATLFASAVLSAGPLGRAAATPVVGGPVLSFSSAVTGGVFREPRVEIARPRLVVREGDALVYELEAPAPGARELGVELVAADGRRVGAVTAEAARASSSVRVPLDAWVGVEIERVELVARGALEEQVGFQVDDVLVEHATTPPTVIFRDALESGARHLHDDLRGAGVRRLGRAVGFDAAFARFEAADVGEPWHAYDLSRLSFAASGASSSGGSSNGAPSSGAPSSGASSSGAPSSRVRPLDASIDHLVGPAIPLRRLSGDPGFVRAEGQRLGLAPVDGGRWYSLYLAVSTDDGLAANVRAFALAEAGERRAFDFEVPARGTLPVGAVRLGAGGPDECVLIELPIVSDVPVRAFELPKDPRVRVHAITFHWRKEGASDRRFRAAWLENQARTSRELGDTRRNLLARCLANQRLGSIFVAPGEEVDLERPLFDALLKRDMNAVDEHLTRLSAAQVTRAAPLKVVRVAFEAPSLGRDRVRFAATDAESWLRAWKDRLRRGVVALDGDPAEARQAPQWLTRLGIDTIWVPEGPSLARWKGPDGAVLHVVAPRARLVDPRELGELPWTEWYARARTSPAEGEILFAVGDDARERATAELVVGTFGALDVAPRVRRATVDAFAVEARRRAKDAPPDVAVPTLRPLAADASASVAESARNARRIAAAVRRLETISAVAFLDGAPSARAATDLAWRAIEAEFGSLAEVPASRARADEIVAALDERLAEQVAVIARGASTVGAGTPIVLVNSLPYARRELVRLEQLDATLTGSDGAVLRSQRTWDGARLFAVDVPACGYEVVHGVVGARDAAARADRRDVVVEGDTARNAHLAFTLDRGAGTVTSVRVPGQDGELLARPATFLDESWTVHSAEFVETGPLRAVARLAFERGEARATVELVLAAHAPTIDVTVVLTPGGASGATEESTPTCARFALRRAVARALVGVPMGSSIAAPGPSGEATRHRLYDWVAGSDGGAGLAILGDACAVVRVEPRVLSVEPLAPDADGTSRTSFALRPFTGGWKQVGLALEAERRATPLVPFSTDAHAGARPARESFLSLGRRGLDGSLVSGPACGVSIAAIAPSEDGSGWTVRLAEQTGLAVEVVLATQRPLFGVEHLDKSGQRARDLRFEEGRVRFWLAPSRVEDLRLRLRP